MGDRFRVTRVDDGSSKPVEYVPLSPTEASAETKADTDRDVEKGFGDNFPVRRNNPPEVAGCNLPENGVFLRRNNTLRHQASSVSEGDAEKPYAVNFDQAKKDQLFLFQEDLDEGLKVGAFLHQSCGPKQPTQPAATGSKTLISKTAPKMGTLMGVFLPCIQNIFGVLMFIRLPFIIGTAGALESLLIVLLASATSLLCAFSMSAIATNGVVPHGGSYFMISRSLGPELGGAVGFMFAIGQSIAAGMYCVAAVEICVTYMAPQLLIVEKANCYRIYGTILLTILGAIAMIGMRLVNKFALLFLACVLMSVGAVLIGMAVNAGGNQDLRLCVLGDRLLAKQFSDPCVKNASSPLWEIFCTNSSVSSCDPYFQEQTIYEELAFPGMGGVSTFYNNTFNQYAVTRQYISRGVEKVFAPTETEFYATRGYVMADISGSFTLLLSIFFPAVTGIMAGSNRSGDLQNVQRSIPLGTIAAVLFTTTTYIVLVFCYAGSVNSLLLRDKYGLSIGGRLVSAEIAWPHPMVLLVGATMATIGAALQTLIGAPRLLLAIAKDGVIDFLRVFRVVSGNGEPRRALLVCLCLGELTILAGSIDLIAPILSQCSLICYLFVNLACALQSLIRHPSWRPRFRFYHWLLSLTGAVLAVAIMFISSWYYACMAIIMATIVYKYIDFRGAETEWGEGWNGLALSAAQYSLHRLEGQVIHTKNWRPQLLVFCRLDEDMKAVHQELFPFVSQLKAGRGLTMFASILEGDFMKDSSDVQLAKKSLRKMMEAENIKGFTEVLVASDTLTGMNHLIQTAGIGAMKHNTVVMCWPQNWRQNAEYKHWRIFLDTLRTCHAAHCAFLVPKNIASFPKNCEKIRGCVDIWWIVHDGGLLMLLPFLMLKTKTWKHCKMRLFTVAQLEDNTVQIQKDLETFLYGLRINAEAHVVEMGTGGISAYTYERTLLMEQRVKLLKEMKLTKRESLKNNVQLIVDQSHTINITDFPTSAGHSKPHKKISINTHPMIISSTVEEALAEQSEDEALVDDVPEENGDVVVNGGPSVSRVRTVDADYAESADSADSVAEAENLQRGKRYGSRVKLTSESERGISERFGGSIPLDGNVRRMHTAVTMNQAIRERSADAELVILNLPRPPKSHREPNEMNYMEFVEVLTDGLKRVLMVRGAGREVVTIYS